MLFHSKLFSQLFLAFGIGVLPCATTLAQSAPQEVRTLELGRAVERELAGGQSHGYALPLMPGQYFTVLVEQQGIDVVVSLSGPDGKALEQFDNDGRSRGRETVARIAEAAGAHRLVVETRQKGTAPGRYSIQLVTLRAASAQDRTLQEARQLSAEAAQLAAASKYAEAQPLAERVLALREAALGPEHAEIASALDRLATIHRNKGESAKAEPLYRRGLAMAEKTFEPDHPDLGLFHNNLAILYFNQGNYLQAETEFLAALKIWEQGLGPEHTSIGRVLSNLAGVYNSKGENNKIEPTLLRALAIREKVLPPDHQDIAFTANNLGTYYFDEGDYARAEPYYQRALRIWEKALGPEHLQVAIVLNNLGGVRQRQRDFAQAEVLYRRALAIREKRLDAEHPLVTQLVLNLAGLYTDQQDYNQAEPLFQRALAAREKALGGEHQDVAVALNLAARPALARGQIEPALEDLTRACEISERNIVANFAAGSERQKLAYLAALAKETDRAISLHSRFAPANAAARELALTTILRRKGRALDAMTDSIAALRRHATPEERALLEQVQSTRAQSARLVMNGPQRTPLAEHQRRLKTLEEQREKLEDEISRRSTAFSAQVQPVTPAAVRAALPARAALIEFAVYHPFNPNYTDIKEQFGPPRYVAYVLRPEGETQWLELGAQEPLDEAIEKLRQALRNPKRRDFRRHARVVDELVMRPLRKLLGPTRRVFVAPDGALNLVPFAALVDERNRFLLQRYRFSYLSSGRDLLRLRPRPASKQQALVLASPDFGEEVAGGAPATERLLTYRPAKLSLSGKEAILSEAYFPPLPATRAEAQALKVLFPDATLHLNKEATETKLKQAHGPRILHIATHGFFLPDAPPPAESASTGALSPMALNGLRGANPLLRSGLALAGANRSQGNAEDDGILTALEAADLDLTDTQLVVLSACDTGVGEIKNGDGVYGLRRALLLAGAETQVLSLWPVSDRATRDLMIGYYRRLQQGEGRVEALRNVQLRLLRPPVQGRGRNYSHPYYWAGFIPSGEWANLAGQR